MVSEGPISGDASPLVEMRPRPPTIDEPLSAQHDVSKFDCTGKLASPQIIEFLKTRALDEQLSRNSATRILRYDGEKIVRAYITTSPSSIGGVPGWDKPVSGLHIAYVGADKSVRGARWGRFLINWSLAYAAKLDSCRCVNLWAYEDMVDYYVGMGFFKHGKAKPDELGPRQLMIFDMVAALRDAADTAAPLPPLPIRRTLPKTDAPEPT